MTALANWLMETFIHRKDVFAEQQASGAYFPTRRAITTDDIEKHLRGEKTIGVYCLDKDNTVKWACVDLDDKKNPESLLPEANKIYDSFTEFNRILEFSGRKGYHIWILFTPSIQAEYAQRLVKARLNLIDAGCHEVFPKQTTLNKTRKYGNLVKLPLSVHRVSGKRSEILRSDIK